MVRKFFKTHYIKLAGYGFWFGAFALFLAYITSLFSLTVGGAFTGIWIVLWVVWAAAEYYAEN